MALIDKMLGKAGGGAPAPVADMPEAVDPAMAGDLEAESTAVELLDSSIDNLTKLAAMLPEADMLVRRLESLRPKAEAADGGEGAEEPDLGGSNPGPAGKTGY